MCDWGGGPLGNGAYPVPESFRGSVRASAEKARERNMADPNAVSQMPKVKRSEKERVAYLEGYEAALQACELNDPKLVRQIFEAVKNV